MTILRFILTVCLAATLSLPASATPQLVAPTEVRELLERYLPLAGLESNAQDATGITTLERRLRQEASELLATEGYFSPKIELLESADGLVLQVEPGPQAHIGSVQIEIRSALAAERRQHLIDNWALPSAAAFRQSVWNDAKQALLRELMAVDHASARLLSSQAEVDVEAARVDLHLVYDAGPSYRYGEIHIVGLQRYPAALVERYSGRLQPGAAYRQEDLLAVQAALQNTPYFSSVSVELERNASPADGDSGAPDVLRLEESEAAKESAAPSDETSRVPIIVRLRERAPYQISLGAGYSSNTGARVEGNFRSADLFGRAWELNTGARINGLNTMKSRRPRCQPRSG
ncbi:autotransporter assembly complex protein TamA, partial [Propionivibrio sp.]|uniref:autotransporter assembly complex protein TamA n=1 Tax=Propionivibrio sp. TaxID=2212460 RepID=UPI003BF20300